MQRTDVPPKQQQCNSTQTTAGYDSAKPFDVMIKPEMLGWYAWEGASSASSV